MIFIYKYKLIIGISDIYNKESLIYRIIKDVLDHLSVLKAVDGSGFFFQYQTFK